MKRSKWYRGFAPIVFVLACAGSASGMSRGYVGWGCFKPELGIAFAGPGASDCGVLDIRSGWFDRRSMRSCAQRATQSAKPFRFGIGVIGVDSGFCSIAVRTGDGQLWSLEFSYDVSAENGSARAGGLAVSRCESVAFTRTKPDEDQFFELRNCVRDAEGFQMVISSDHKKAE